MKTGEKKFIANFFSPVLFFMNYLAMKSVSGVH